METTTITIRKDLADRLGVLAERDGTDLSSFVTARLERIGSGFFGRILSRFRRERYSLKPEVLAELEREEEDVRRGVGVSPGFTDTKDLMAWLYGNKSN